MRLKLSNLKVYLHINRITVEFKLDSSCISNRNRTDINRITVEFKCIVIASIATSKSILIESQWNLNHVSVPEQENESPY